MSSCCTLRLKRRSAFSRDSPSCSRISAKQIHPQTRPVGPTIYFKDLTGSQAEKVKNFATFGVSRKVRDAELLYGFVQNWQGRDRGPEPGRRRPWSSRRHRGEWAGKPRSFVARRGEPWGDGAGFFLGTIARARMRKKLKTGQRRRKYALARYGFT